MLCEYCKQNVATIHYTEIEDEKLTELHLCEECAKKTGIGIASLPSFSLAHLLEGFMDIETKEIEQCSGCGMRFKDFKKFGKLGCSKCYSAFQIELSGLLHKIHGNISHIGKLPTSSSKETKIKQELSMLRKRLEELVREEAFEEAAKIRDKIRELEAKEREYGSG